MWIMLTLRMRTIAGLQLVFMWGPCLFLDISIGQIPSQVPRPSSHVDLTHSSFPYALCNNLLGSKKLVDF